MDHLENAVMNTREAVANGTMTHEAETAQPIGECRDCRAKQFSLGQAD